MRPPKEFVERWAYENPKQAFVVCSFGFAMFFIAVLLVFTDP